MSSLSHDSTQAQAQTTRNPAQLVPLSSVAGPNSPCSPHDDSVLFLLDQGYRVGSDANRSWYEQQQGGQSSPLPEGRSAGRVIDIEEDKYPFSQSLRDTALSPTLSIATSFTDISYSEATTGFSTPHFTASISGSDAAAPRPTMPEPATPDSAIFARVADQLAAALEEDIRAAELGAAGRGASTNTDSPAAGPSRTRAERRHDARIARGYTRGPGGSYRREAQVALSTPLSHAGASAPKTRKQKKRRTKLGAVRFYCGKCRTDGVDHVYDTCPTWLVCMFCTKVGHLGYACPTPHHGCNGANCFVPGDQPNIRDMCPMSCIRHMSAWTPYQGEPGEQDMGLLFFEEADWDSFRTD
jgi:hypothetical protein